MKKINDTPLITLAVFTYNQEQFVAEAFSAAIAQEYEPLEIIFSDDCSTDGTFEKIKDLVSNYNGKHKLRARKTSKNIGVFAHVVEVGKLVHGELVVLAAGDDISKPDRVTALVDTWKTSGAWGLYSRYDRISENGELISVNDYSRDLELPTHKLRTYFYPQDGEVGIIHGATSAYDRRLFDYINKEMCSYILSEDGALSLLLNLLKKKIIFVDKSLVLYRTNANSITNAPVNKNITTLDEIESGVEKSALYAKSCKNRALLLLNLSRTIDNVDLRRINMKSIESDVISFTMRHEWISQNLVGRVKYLFSMDNINDFNWMLARILGFRFFTIVKWAVRNIQYSLGKISAS